MKNILTTKKENRGYYSYNLVAITLGIESGYDGDEPYTTSFINVDINIANCIQVMDTISDEKLRKEFIYHINTLNILADMHDEDYNISDLSAKEMQDYYGECVDEYLEKISERFNLFAYSDPSYYINKDKTLIGMRENDDSEPYIDYNNRNQEYIEFFKKR